MISDGRRRCLHAGLAWAGSLVLPRAQANDAFPRTVSDALGRPVRLAKPPQRLVVIFPSNVEIAFALGLSSRIVAIGGKVNFPVAALTKTTVGGALGYSAEAVAAQSPDLVVVTPSHHSALGLVAPCERLGIPVLVLQHPDLPAIFRNIRLLGEACGEGAAADALVADMTRQLTVIGERLAGAPRRRVYLETAAAGHGAYQTIGQGHYAHDALRQAGGDNVFADLSGAQQISAEALFLRDPDVIISLQKNPASPAEIARRPGWHALRAVRQGRVVVLPRRAQLIPGPRQIEAVRDYAAAIHPERFHA